ncbi:hypothetical protein ACEUAM_02900 [Aeromonas hydrophila]|uniref:hypothetical protein n=1 Tax=Aeromonas TaxID=642 RepID=UPI002B48193E|nr:hypothetical protein [Aeromonas veronii]
MNTTTSHENHIDVFLSLLLLTFVLFVAAYLHCSSILLGCCFRAFSSLSDTRHTSLWFGAGCIGIHLCV